VIQDTIINVLALMQDFQPLLACYISGINPFCRENLEDADYFKFRIFHLFFFARDVIIKFGIIFTFTA
jgi:hypothetical protein